MLKPRRSTAGRTPPRRLVGGVSCTLLVFLALASVIQGCSVKPELKPFASDGCSLFPDQTIDGRVSWCDCCFNHDLAYWLGGSREDRQAADLALKACVLEKSSDAQLAELMYQAVRWGGSPYFPNWYRWGYGWPYTRSYAPLTAAEQQQVETLLRDYFAAKPLPLCAGRQHPSH